MIAKTTKKRRRRQSEQETGHVRFLHRRLDSIFPSPENSRLYRPVDPQDPEIVALAHSIRRYGILDPLVISTDNYILSGHRRHTAARKAGLRTVPCRVEEVCRLTEPDQFLARLREHNRQRVKSLDELLREEVVSADPQESHRALVQHRIEASAIEVDTFALGTKKRRSTLSAAKEPFLAAVKKVLDARRKFWPLSDRQIHYALLNQPPLIHASKPASTYSNTPRAYKSLTDLLTRGRLAGRIPMRAIADETRPVETWRVWANHQPYVRAELRGLFHRYYRNLMQSQPNHVEILAEKNTVARLVKGVAEDFCIPVTITRGQCSLPPRYQLAERFRKSGKEKLILLMVTDHDPDGESIAAAVPRSLRDDFGIKNVEAVKVALTADQIDEYGLQANMEAKKGSATYKRFVAKYGTDVFELEALPPEDLQDILRDSIEAVVDLDAFNAEVDAEAEDAAFLDAARCRVMAALAGVLDDDEGEGPE